MQIPSFFGMYRRLQIEGIMPERALLRLQRAKIPVFHVKKTQKNFQKLFKNVLTKDFVCGIIYKRWQETMAG